MRYNLGINEELFNRSYETFSSILSKSRCKFSPKLLKKLDYEYREMIEQQDGFHFGYRSILHEIRTFDFLSRLDKVKINNPDKAGPDFICDGAIFECTVASLGSPERKKKYLESKKKRIASEYPSKYKALRITSSIDSKKKQYQKHLSKGYIDSTLPFILVLDISILSYFSSFGSGESEMLFPLLGVGETLLYIEIETGKYERYDYNEYNNLEKRNGSLVDLKVFLSDKYKFLTAIVVINTSPDIILDFKNVTIFENIKPLNKYDFRDWHGASIWRFTEEKSSYKISIIE